MQFDLFLVFVIKNVPNYKMSPSPTFEEKVLVLVSLYFINRYFPSVKCFVVSILREELPCSDI